MTQKNALGMYNIILLFLVSSRKCFQLVDLFYWISSVLLLQDFNSLKSVNFKCHIKIIVHDGATDLYRNHYKIIFITR